MIEKTCSACCATLPVQSFSKDKSVKDGYARLCKLCRGEQRRAKYAENPEHYKTKVRDWAARNKDKVLAGKRAYRENAQIKLKIREYLAAYREKHRDRLKQYFRDHFQANKIHRMAYAREYTRQRPESKRATEQRRRAALSGARGKFSASDVRRLLKLQRYSCAACRKSIKSGYHIDHIEPLSKGGSNDALNLQLLCPRCNIRKSARDPLEFMQSIGFLL